MSDLSRRDVLNTAGQLGAAAAPAGTAGGQGRPSADDLSRTVKGARVFDLSFVWSEQSPILSLNPPYSFALNRTHKMTYEIFGQAPGSRVSWASDIMYFSGQHGAPTIDAIGHIGRDLKLHGGVDAVAATATPGGIGADLGIYIVENANLEALGDAKAYVVLLILTPLRIQGASGSPLRAIALTP